MGSTIMAMVMAGKMIEMIFGADRFASHHHTF